MFRFLKGILSGGEAPGAPAILPVKALPAWIRGEEGKVQEELAGVVAAHRDNITGAIGRMVDVLAAFDTAEMEEVPHRKLAGVTERSLPLFLKAMKASLSRGIPGDPEAFYAVTGEILKGCLSAFRGQGRYLSSRFPAEMRALRDGVDTIGREANAMTPGIAKARERLRALGELREALGRHQDAVGRAALAAKEIRSLEDETTGSRASLESVQRTLGDLTKGEEFRECEQELARIQDLEEERDRAVRDYRGIAATAIHLLGKGEKIASRRKHREDARFLHEALALLGGDFPLPGDSFPGILTRGQEAMAALAASGDLPPKNREETVLLGEPGRLAREVQELSQRFSSLSAEIAAARETVHSRPALAKSRELRNEAVDLEKRVDRMQERLEQVRAGVPELESRVQTSFRDLDERVTALSGGSVRIGEPGPAPAG